MSGDLARILGEMPTVGQRPGAVQGAPAGGGAPEPAPEPPHEPTVGDVIAADPTIQAAAEEAGITIEDYSPAAERVMPGFAMADEPEDLPGGEPSSPALVDESTPEPASRALLDARSGDVPGALTGEILPPHTRTVADQDVIAPGELRYESRIRVLEAYKYPGNLVTAPAWIDRNWVGYGDWDPVRNIPAGPVLRVPTDHGVDVLARPGDYVVKQAVVLDGAKPPVIKIEVWAKEQFEKLFVSEVA